jgi:hypothetical protein
MSNNIDPTLRAGVLTRLLKKNEAEEREAPPESLFRASAAGDSFELMGLDAPVNDDDVSNLSPGRQAAKTLSQGEDFNTKLHEASETTNLRKGEFDMAALQKLANGEDKFTDATAEQKAAAQYYLDHPGALDALDNGDGNADGIYSFNYLTRFADQGIVQLDPDADDGGFSASPITEAPPPSPDEPVE